MLEWMLKVACCGAGGAAAALACRRWMQCMLQKREKELRLPQKQRWLLVAVMAVLGGVVGVMTSGVPAAACGLLLLGICEAVCLIDWELRIIPNETVLAILALKVLFGVPALLGAKGFPPFEPVQSLLGLAVCFGVFFVPGLFGKRVGAGDIKLAAAMGFFLGLQGALLAVVLMGLLVIGYCLMQQQMPILRFFKTNIPMGPFIAAGMLAAFLWSGYTL